MKSLLILTLSAWIAAVTATNFCNPELCSGKTHIGCGNTGAFSPTCPSGATTVVPMTNALRDKILDSHNRKRNTIAGGTLYPFQPAVRMPTMVWNDELALLASYNVKTCLYQPDQCHKTDEFRYSGQNIGKQFWIGTSSTDEKLILDLIDMWWAEYKAATLSDIVYFPAYTGRKITHFTVMASDRNTALGCAGIRFPKDGWDTLTFTCNYATTNMIGYPVYKAGIAASFCTTGTNSNYTKLCSLSEVVNPNLPS